MENCARSAKFAHNPEEKGKIMDLAEIYEAISGCVAILEDFLTEPRDPRLWTIMAALKEANRAIDQMVNEG